MSSSSTRVSCTKTVPTRRGDHEERSVSCERDILHCTNVGVVCLSRLPFRDGDVRCQFDHPRLELDPYRGPYVQGPRFGS